MPSLAVSPDANPETTTVDGFVARDGVNETWATIRAGAGNLADDISTGAVFCQITMSATTNQFASIVRAIFLFDTSTIPAGNVVESATLRLYFDSAELIQTLTGQEIVIAGSTPASNTALATSDYGQLGGTAFSTPVALSALTMNAANTLTLTNFSGITIGGITKLGLRIEADRANAQPTWASGARAAVGGPYADGTVSDPLLTVVYGPPVAAETGYAFLMSLAAGMLALFSDKFFGSGLMSWQHVLKGQRVAVFSAL